MKSIQRQWRFVLMCFGVSLAFAPPAHAQRSGFIVGFGLGPGYYSASQAGASQNQSKAGVGLDFHLGGVVGNGFEIYWVQKAIYSGSDSPAVDLVASGVGGIGVAYPVTPTVDVHGGIGFGLWIESSADGTSTSDAEGIGLVGGARYKLNESGRWMLNADVMYGKPTPDPDFSVLGLQLTINIMSH